GVEHALVEELGVGEKERSIPTKQYQAGNATRSGITLDVVVAPNTIDSAEHCEMWAPAIPQELDDRNNYADPNAGDHTEHRNADKPDNRQPEFPLLNAEDATQVCEFEQADGRGDHDRGERAAGQILQQARCEHQKERDRKRAHNSGELRL